MLPILDNLRTSNEPHQTKCVHSTTNKDEKNKSAKTEKEDKVDHFSHERSVAKLSDHISSTSDLYIATKNVSLRHTHPEQGYQMILFILYTFNGK